MLVDVVKVRHWMNVRKVTVAWVADRLGLPPADLDALLGGDDADLSEESAGRLAAILDVAQAQLSARGERELDVVVMTAKNMYRTRRPLQRDGIHFYNYYTMAAPPGRVGPVILDILCPADRPAALNNGHLEPAITVNLGPGDITGRWGVEINEHTLRVMSVNRGQDRWIVGDSYVEPTYCPHSYALASGEPARIISYTAVAPLGRLVEDCDRWPDRAFATLLDAVAGASAGALLGCLLARRGYDAATADEAAGLAPGTTAELLADAAAPGLEVARALGAALGFDYRLLLPPLRQHDAVGKTYCSVEDSRGSVRRFRGYTVASMAHAAHLTDLTGLFMRVRDDGGGQLDLCDLAETHYLVVGGSARLWWHGPAGTMTSALLGPDDSAWVGPCVAHGWTGDASLVRLGSGEHVSYLDTFELTNTFEVRKTLTRARHDRLPWGYDPERAAG